MNRAASVALVLACAAALPGALWLARGRARGRTKRLAYRAAMLLIAAGLVESARRGGLFARSSAGFTLAIGAMVLLVVVGQLYGVRFCGACGRMVRDFRPAACPRCRAALPRHGFTEAPRRPPQDPTAPLGSRRAPADGEPRSRGPAPS